MAVINLYDRANNYWVPAQDTDVTDMVASGKYGLQSGIDIPVTFSDGTMGTVPSDKFEEGAVNKQIRFQTQDDLRAYDKQQQEAINQKVYGDAEDTTVGAFSQGFTRGLVPGADLIMEGMGGLVGHGQDVKEGLAQTKERHPIASTIGEVGGMLSNPLLSKAGTAVKGIGEGLAGTALEQLGGTGLVAGAVKTVAGVSAEGAFYGLPQGISEATLGDPNEVAQNLAAGPAMGALFGGSFGSAFAATKAAAPFFKSAINAATDAGSELVSSVLQKGTKAAINVIPSVAEQAEFQKVAGDLAGHPEVLQAWQNGGESAVKEIRTKIESLQSQFEKQTSGLKNQLVKDLEGQPEAIRNQIESDFVAANGSLPDAMKNGLAAIEAEKSGLYSQMNQDQTFSTLFGGDAGIHAETTKTIKLLEQTKDPKARAIAKTLESRINGEMAAKGTYMQDGEVIVGLNTEGSDAILTRELNERARLGLENKKLPSAARDILSEYQQNMDYLVRNNSKFGEAITALDNKTDAYEKFTDFAGKYLDKSGNEIKDNVIKSILSDPRKARDFDSVLSNLSEYMPEFQAYREAGATAGQKMNALREASAKFDAMRNPAFDRGLTLDDMQNLFENFGQPKNIGEQLSKLRAAQAQLGTQDAGPVSKYIRLSQALGNEIDPQLAKLQPFENQFSVLSKLKDSATTNKDPLANFITRTALGRVARKIGRWVGGPILGEAAGIGAQVAMSGGLNTYNTLMTLRKLDSAQRMSFRIISAATNGAVNALTGTTASKLGAVTAGAVGEKYLNQKTRTLQEARKDFNDRSDYLNKLTTDPNFLANEAQSRISGLEHTPGVGAALASHFANTAIYLANTLPKNPLAGTGVPFTNDFGWQPSDTELSAYERRVNAAENPARAIQDLGNGKISPEALQTLGTLHPALLGRLQKGLSDAIISGKTKLSYPQRLQIGQILGVRADSSVSPQFVNAMQSNLSTQGPGAPPKGPQGPHSGGFHPARLNINTDSHATDTSRVTYGH